MMTYLTVLATALMLILLVGLGRVLQGPTAADRVLAVQLFGTTGVAILTVLAVTQQQTALLNVALVLAVLAPLMLMTFVTLAGKKI